MEGIQATLVSNELIRDAVESRRNAERAVSPRSCAATPAPGLPPPPAEVRAESLAFLNVLTEVWQMHLAKTKDYGRDDDALANIRHGAETVNIEPWRACLVRIADKITRLRTFCHNGNLVHEGVEDTFLDLTAYAAIALVLYRQEARG